MAGRVGRHLARNAVAYVALFIALSGGAYAAVTVGSAQVANNSLRSVDIRNRGITGVDIARRTLRAEHFRPGVLRRAQGPAGPKGDPGAPGAAGPSVDIRNRGITGVDIARRTSATAAGPQRAGHPVQRAHGRRGAPPDGGAALAHLDAGAGRPAAGRLHGDRLRTLHADAPQRR